MLLPDGTNVNHTLVQDGWCWRVWITLANRSGDGYAALEGLNERQ
jgi:endonuclease YncB( thermonuclease family)